jgi:hypothetical protein
MKNRDYFAAATALSLSVLLVLISQDIILV